MTCLPRRWSRAPELAVERSVLDGFRDMRWMNVGIASETGDGAGSFEEAVVGAGGEAKLLNGGKEQRFDRFGRGAVRSDFLSVPM
jgi:hypothetical protein